MSPPTAYTAAYEESKPSSASASASTSLTARSINAERFIPQHKREQWDNTPSMLIVTTPSRTDIIASSAVYAPRIKPLTQWIYDPIKRRSILDQCSFNLLHYLPEAINSMQISFYQKEMLFFGPSVFQCSIWKAQLWQAQDNVVKCQEMVKSLQEKLNSFADLDDSSMKHPSIAEIRVARQRNCEDVFSESRVIQTTPETVAKVCDEIQTIVEGGTVEPGVLDAVVELKGCLKMVCQDHCTKTNMLVDIERLQAVEDVKAYDLYSCKFEFVEIPPPRQPEKGCPGCSKRVPEKKNPRRVKYCGYHTNLMYARNYRDDTSFPILERSQGSNKASIVRGEQFGVLKDVIKELAKSSGARSGQRIIGYLCVPGVAENRPLVSIGDLVRLRFGQIECIGEVGEVEIKSERIMLFLPLVECGHLLQDYFDALMYPKNRRMGDFLNRGRFDVRFGLFQSRAHDIYKAAVSSAVSTSPGMEQVIRVVAPTPFLKGIQKKSARRPHIGISDWANTLNAEQKHAVFDIVRSNHGMAPYCIYGPPGTGKTMTVVESIVQLLRHDSSAKILVCAPSDAACDVIAKRLLPVMPNNDSKNLLRINWWSRNPASLPPVLLSCTPMNELGSFVLPSQVEMQAASVIICQCFVAGCLDIGAQKDANISSKARQKPWMDTHFTHVFIDESSQSFEFESLIPLLKVGADCSIVLAGDPKQLGPTVRSSCASRNGLSLSLQERLMGLSLYQMDSNYCVITKLLDNYRSHDALLRVPSELFYNGSLRCKASSEITSACRNFELLTDGNKFPMMVYDVSEGKERSKLDTPSFFNIEECNAVVKIIKALLASPNVQIHSGQIAVITCFRAQVLKMREILRKEGLPTVNVGVVEDFQGQEISVVLISTVLTENQERWRSGAKGGLGLMTDPKRFNVAITRASALCVVVGKVNYLEGSGSYWTALIEHVRRNGGISGDSKFITNDADDDEGENDDIVDYGITDFIRRVEELNLLGSGHEMDRYDLAMRGYYQDAPEWKVCL